jgi:hypothetical protein
MSPKRGSENLMTFWFFACLIVAGAGATLIVASYAGKPVDVNTIEASLLHNKIMECINENGFLKKEVMAKDFDLKSFCGINNNIHNNFYFRINFTLSDKEIREKLTIGNQGYEADCDSMSGRKAEAFADCYYKNESILLIGDDKEIQRIKLYVLSASNNQGERIVK